MTSLGLAFIQYDWFLREAIRTQIHRGETIWRHKVNTAIYNQGETSWKKSTLWTPWFWTSSLQKCEKINFCVLSHTACVMAALANNTTVDFSCTFFPHVNFYLSQILPCFYFFCSLNLILPGFSSQCPHKTCYLEQNIKIWNNSKSDNSCLQILPLQVATMFRLNYLRSAWHKFALDQQNPQKTERMSCSVLLVDSSVMKGAHENQSRDSNLDR